MDLSGLVSCARDCTHVMSCKQLTQPFAVPACLYACTVWHLYVQNGGLVRANERPVVAGFLMRYG